MKFKRGDLVVLDNKHNQVCRNTVCNLLRRCMFNGRMGRVDMPLNNKQKISVLFSDTDYAMNDNCLCPRQFLRKATKAEQCLEEL